MTPASQKRANRLLALCIDTMLPTMKLSLPMGCWETFCPGTNLRVLASLEVRGKDFTWSFDRMVTVTRDGNGWSSAIPEDLFTVAWNPSSTSGIPSSHRLSGNALRGANGSEKWDLKAQQSLRSLLTQKLNALLMHASAGNSLNLSALLHMYEFVRHNEEESFLVLRRR